MRAPNALMWAAFLACLAFILAVAVGCIPIGGDSSPDGCTDLGLAAAPEATKGSSWKKAAPPPRPAARPAPARKVPGLTSSSAPRHRRDIDVDVTFCG